MKNMLCCGFVSAALAVSVAAGAQDKMGKMGETRGTSYTGCVGRSQSGAFTLSHATDSRALNSRPMSKDPMSKDSMPKDSMAKEPMTQDSMMKDEMTSSLTLSSTSVDLGKHVGQKVTVKGAESNTMDGMATFSVTSIKVVAKSCA